MKPSGNRCNFAPRPLQLTDGHTCSGFCPLPLVRITNHYLPSAWNVSWNGALDNPSAAGAISAMT